MGILNNESGYEPSSTSVEMEYKRSKARGRFDIIICIVIVLAFLLYKESAAGKENIIQIKADTITITATDGTVRDVAFDEITDVELFDDFDDFDQGELISGGAVRNCLSGMYRNDTYGEYGLYVTPKYKNYIVMETPDGVIVFNYESMEDTVATYNLISELMTQ